jgi:hypothetical protein
MTQTQILNSLRTNPNFALGFALDNNFKGVQSVLMNEGYDVQTKVEALNILKMLLETDKQKCISLIAKVPYNNKAVNDNGGPSYTAGFSDYFRLKTPPNAIKASEKGFSFDGLLAGLGAGLMAYTSLSAIGNTNGAVDASVAQSKAEAEAKAKAEADAKKEKQKMWMLGGIGALVVFIAIYLFTRPKKTNS